LTTAILPQKVRQDVTQIVNEVPILDIHTHLYDLPFGGLLLWGIDELLTYHYLVAEVFRVAPLEYEKFWSWSKREQADTIWKHLFLERSPVSEACRGVLTTLDALGLDVESRDLKSYREYFDSTRIRDYLDRVFDLANMRMAVMTNDPFDPQERPVWEGGVELDPRFRAVLRMDPLLNNWGNAARQLNGWGYAVSGSLHEKDQKEVRKFLEDWIGRMNPAYMAVSMPNDFRFPDTSARKTLIETCVLPVARDRNIPFALMIGVNRQVNPNLQLAGDSVGKADIASVEHLCALFPKNKFLVTMLSRENQHELCVTARKFPNLMIFGCWWFLNNPSVIEEMTRERFELLGLSMIPQHSDARVLDQVIYKWKHSRGIIANVLADKYEDLIATGWTLSREEIVRDVEMIFGGNFERFLEWNPS
jgi:hypothetical protein